MPRVDMVRAYTESLLREILQSDPVVDGDGDYPVGYGDGGFYVRIVSTNGDDPVVQVFAVALDGIEPGADLYERINAINAAIHFGRAFFVRDQVLIEAELPGLELSPASFTTAMSAVGSAAQHFGPRLMEEFGGESSFVTSPDREGPDGASDGRASMSEHSGGDGGYL